jgi:hypothetical protein
LESNISNYKREGITRLKIFLKELEILEVYRRVERDFGDGEDSWKTVSLSGGDRLVLLPKRYDNRKLQ